VDADPSYLVDPEAKDLVGMFQSKSPSGPTM
jgi:hypothetical protein